MENYDFNFDREVQPSFDEVPSANRVRVFGVDYVVLRGMQGGYFYFTRYGWPLAVALRPLAWYNDERFRTTGTRLLTGTGTVYRVPLPHPELGTIHVVIKFNRFAQEAPVFFTARDSESGWDNARIRGARFLSPFEEFSLLEKLRTSPRSAEKRPILAQRPYGIYSPALHCSPWQLGRNENSYWAYDRALAIDQAAQPEERRVRHDWNRVYITLFQWIEGLDAEYLAENNLLGDLSLEDFSRECHKELADHGFAVWDSKPRHLILRVSNRDGTPKPMLYHNRPAWALIDYELLYRPAHPKPLFPALEAEALAPESTGVPT